MPEVELIHPSAPAVLDAFKSLPALTQVRVRNAKDVQQVLAQPAMRAYFAGRTPPVEYICEEKDESPSGQ